MPGLLLVDDYDTDYEIEYSTIPLIFRNLQIIEKIGLDCIRRYNQAPAHSLVCFHVSVNEVTSGGRDFR